MVGGHAPQVQYHQEGESCTSSLTDKHTSGGGHNQQYRWCCVVARAASTEKNRSASTHPSTGPNEHLHGSGACHRVLLCDTHTSTKDTSTSASDMRDKREQGLATLAGLAVVTFGLCEHAETKRKLLATPSPSHTTHKVPEHVPSAMMSMSSVAYL